MRTLYLCMMSSLLIGSLVACCEAGRLNRIEAERVRLDRCDTYDCWE